MKSNVKKKKQPKVKLGDKVASTLFCDIIDFLIYKYDESPEKETMSFRAYCVGLVDLSNKKIGKEECKTYDIADDDSQLKLQKGE